MIKQLFVLLVGILLVIQTNSTAIKNVKPKANVSPYALIDEAQANLEKLRNTTKGAIQQAYLDFDDITTAAADQRTIVLNNSEIAINQGYETINDDLTTIKDLAFNADKDISACLDGREDLLGTLQAKHIELLTECLDASNKAMDDIIEDSRYLVEIIINKVNELEFQLGRCNSGSILCIAPIVSEIELQMVQLPQRIQVEVDRTSNLFEGWKSGIPACATQRISNAIREGNTVLQEISECVNEILG